MKTRVFYLLPLGAFIALFIVLNVVTPLALGPAGILLVFGLIYIVVVSFSYSFVSLALSILLRFGLMKHSSLLPGRRLYYLISFMSLGPVFLLALNSLGQLEWKDFLLVLLLISIGSFYVLRKTRS